jgi:hypothetical protein
LDLSFDRERVVAVHLGTSDDLELPRRIAQLTENGEQDVKPFSRNDVADEEQSQRTRFARPSLHVVSRKAGFEAVASRGGDDVSRLLLQQELYRLSCRVAVEDESVDRFQVALLDAAIPLELPLGMVFTRAQMVDDRYDRIRDPTPQSLVE